eukprot:PhF_6_TR37752/c0_g1_i1/m.56209
MACIAFLQESTIRNTLMTRLSKDEMETVVARCARSSLTETKRWDVAMNLLALNNSCCHSHHHHHHNSAYYTLGFLIDHHRRKRMNAQQLTMTKCYPQLRLEVLLDVLKQEGKQLLDIHHQSGRPVVLRNEDTPPAWLYVMALYAKTCPYYFSQNRKFYTDRHLTTMDVNKSRALLSTYVLKALNL